jgi:hypothetical protein
MDMTESNEPDKKNEAAETAEDEPIIELKDETAVAPTDDEELKGDEEIIDLLQAVDEPLSLDQDEPVSAEAKEPTEDQTPIELKEEVADETKDDEETIDLVDAVEEIPLKNDTENSVDEVSEPAEDETIIDLTETVGDIPLNIEAIGKPIPDAADAAQEFDDISELDGDLIEETMDYTDELDSGTIADDVLRDNFADSLGIEFDSEEDAKENLFDPGRVSSEQVEAALERVVKKMFYEKIDRLLVDAIEKTVKREIERLKKALLDDPTNGEK